MAELRNPPLLTAVCINDHWSGSLLGTDRHCLSTNALVEEPQESREQLTLPITRTELVRTKRATWRVGVLRLETTEAAFTICEKDIRPA
jgi:hypothetical protein